jgi:leucyl-tRNA synthetase
MTLEWSDEAVAGSHRFLKRLWKFVADRKYLFNSGPELPIKKAVIPVPYEWSSASPEQLAVRRKIHALLKQANHDFQKYQFNTVVSGAMQILNLLQQPIPGATQDGHSELVYNQILHEGLSILIRLLSPIVPHVTHALWSELAFGGDILDAAWPMVDISALAQSNIEIGVQVNGKLRGRVLVPVQAAEQQLRELALADEGVQKHVAGKSVKKVIVVPGKLINIVVAG